MLMSSTFKEIDMLTCTATPDYDPFTIIVDSKGVAVRAIDLMMSFTVDSQCVARAPSRSSMSHHSSRRATRCTSHAPTCC